MLLLVFRKLGIPATLVSPDKMDWPSMIFLPPNALKVLRWLGLESMVHNTSIQIDRHDYVNRLGIPLRVMGPGFYTDPSGLTIRVMDGRRFHKIIQTAVEDTNSYLVTGNAVENLYINIETRPWMAEALLSSTGNSYTGYWLTEGVVDFDLPLTMATSVTDVWTDGGRLRICPIGEGRVFWQGRVPQPGGLQPPQDILGWIKSQMSGTSGVISSFIQRIDHIHLSVAERVKWIENSIHHNRIIVGEAKVQLTGESLQAQAIYMEEAFQLAHYLAKSSDWLGAVAQYQEKCSRKSKLIFSDDFWTSQFHRSSYGRFILNMLIRFLPEKSLKQQLNNLYSVNGLDSSY